MNNMKHRAFHLLLAIFLFCAYCNAQELGKHDFIKHGLFYRDIKNPGYDSTVIRLPGKTYAVIINGSKDLKSNRESYWNDCSFLYTTLRNYYKIPRTNISVIMSDGKDPGADITMEDNSVVSSPLDLDGDGTDDIDYAATKENIKAVFSGLSNRIYSSDHLLVFIVGHGYKDQASYISLWGNEGKLYPQELSDYVKDIKAGYMTFVLGQCYSGGFVDALQADNRLVLAACGKDEKSWTRPDIPYDEFVSLFTSALSRVNIFDEEVDADYDKNGVVTLLEAYRYAEENDGYKDGDFSFGDVREHPMASYLAGTNIEDLSLSYIPNPVELIFSDGSGQGKAPWATDAIALSPESDGMDWTNSNSDFSQSTDKSVVVKVRNRGVKPYSQADKSVSLYWSEAFYDTVSDSWRWDTPSSGDHSCGMFATATLDGTILPGRETSVTLEKKFDKKTAGQISSDNVGLNYCAVIYDTDKGVADHKATSVLKSVQAATYGNERNVFLANHDGAPVSYSLRFNVTGKDGDDLFRKAELEFRSSGITSHRYTLDGVKEDAANSGTFIVEGNGAEISGIKMEAGECLATSLGCSFYADEAIPDTSFYNVAVSVTDDATGKCVGGENFIVRSLPRKAIKVTPERYIYNGKHFLTLSDASERVSCQWFDPDGRYLGEEYTFAIGDDPVLGEYKVRVCSKKDGALVYDSLKVVNDLLQKSLKIDAATSRIYITFRHELQEDVDVIVSTTSVKGQTTHLPKGQKNYTVHYNSVGGINSVVMVTFIVNGVKTETYKLQ
ncbi:C13 family peptidase [uncultured Prevotella sp.]|uniref:C13 family peptidase n=1 Tax=uncultured Prevotella sp. TaxID=159272 RepID=UPI0025980907|nr:C13 family peptidase [uncultured Prevotella sp.]